MRRVYDPDLQPSVKMMAPAPTLGSLILLSLSVINAQAQGESSRARVKIVSINIQMLEIKSRKLTFKIDKLLLYKYCV